MIKRTMCRTFVFLILVLGSGLVSQAQNRPNIVFILADDLGYADVGFNGSTDIPTPELDALAEGGTIFSSAYVLHPFCGPSRAGLLTGRYPHEIGSQFNLPSTGTGSELGVPVDQKFMSKMLQEAGYQTSLIGKWHLGTEAQYHPNVRGFDDFYGFLGGGHEYFPDYYKAQYANGSNWDYNFPMEHNGVAVTDDDEYITDELSHEGVRFIEEAAAGEDPFFLFMSYNAPHTPLRAKTEDLAVAEIASISDETRKTYAAMVYALDRGVGEIVDALIAEGVYDNTLIIFLSDNGGRTDQGANNAPLTGAKGNTWEGGFRVPMFWHWPGNVPVQTYDYVVSALDFYPTFAEMADADISGNSNLDGKNILSEVLTGTNARPGDPIFALRHNNSANEVGVRRDQWKLHKYNTGTWKLYNLETDISETTDLSAQYPELTDTLIARAKLWSQDHVEPLFFHAQAAADAWETNNMPNYDATFGDVIDLGGEFSTPFTDPSNTGGWIYNEEVSDEFIGASLDEEKWLIQGRDGEYQSNWIGRAPSQFSTDNVRVEDGKLKLQTRWEPDFDFSEVAQSDGTVYENITTSAVITRKQFLYGYMEIRCKAADAEITSSFWTTGFESELDLFEFFGDHRQPQKESQGLDKEYKWQFIDWSPGLTERRVYGEDHILDWRVADDFHVYGCEWDPEFLKLYADGELIGSVTKDQIEAMGKEWVLTNPFWIWVDQETFPWNGIPTVEDATEFPVDFEIDYIRVWQKDYKNLLDRALFGFEGPLRMNGTWKYWTISGNSANHLAIVNDKSVEGNNSLKFSHESALTSDIVAVSPSGTLNMLAGEYTLSAKVWLESGTAPDKITVSFADAGEAILELPTVGLNTGQWVTLKTNFTRAVASTATDKLNISVLSVDVGNAAVMYIEDISIKPYTGVYEGSVWNGISWDVDPPAENAILSFEGNYNQAGNLRASSMEIAEGKTVVIPTGSTLEITGNAVIGSITTEGVTIFEDFEAASIPTSINVSDENVSLVTNIQSRDSRVLKISHASDSRVFYEFTIAEAGDYKLSFLMTSTNSYYYTRLETPQGVAVGTIISTASSLSTWTTIMREVSLNPGTYYLRLQTSNNTTQSIFVDDIKVESLNVSTGTTYESRLVIASGASLIVPVGFDQPVTFKRNTTYGDNERKYSFVGIPVQAQAEISGADLGMDVFQYDETNPYDADAGLSRWEDALDMELEVGKGYTQTSQKEMAFTGIPNTGNITITNLTKTANGTASTDNQGWHLISNPYGASIDVSKFLTANSGSIESSIRIWDDGLGVAGGRGNGGSYLTANTIETVGGSGKSFEGYIGSMQGFFVKVLNDNTEVVFTQDMIVANQNGDDSFFRKTEQDNIIGVKLLLSDGQSQDGLYIGMLEDATGNYDPHLDATKLMLNDQLQFYSLIGENKFAIQAIGSEKEEVKLGFNDAELADLEISVLELQLPNEGMTFYLHDSKKGETFNLRNLKVHRFQADAKASQNRFSITYAPSDILGIKDLGQAPLFRRFEDKIQIDFQQPEDVLGYVIYDMSGKVVKRLNTANTDVTTMDIAFDKEGIYVLKLVSSKFVYSRKFIN